MKKRDIKEIKKEIVKLMKKKDFTFYYKSHTDLSPTKKGTFNKLVKKISKKYNTIVVLNSDKVLIHDMHTDMYEITNIDMLNREYDNIVIEADTVVLIQVSATKDFSIYDALTLYNNFIHSNKSKNKVLFYSFFVSKDRLFDHCLSDLNDCENHNQKMYKKYPDFIEIRDAYKNKSLKERNLFYSYIERFMEMSRYTLLSKLGLTYEDEIKDFELKYMGGEQITNLYNENKIDKELFNKFISELFMHKYHWTYESLFGSYINALYYELRWRLIKYAKNATEKNIIKIDSKVDTKNQSIMIYELLNNEGCDGIGVSVTFTFDELYDMIVKKGDEDNEDIDGQKSLVLEKETTVSTTVDDITNLNLNFPLETDRKCTNIENFFIIMEKMVYKVFRDDYTINKMDEIHNSFFKRKSSVQYLFTRKLSKEMRDEYINSAYLSILFEKCIFGGDMLQDFITDILYILSSYHDSNKNHLSAKEIRDQAFVGFKNTFQSENEIQIEMMNKANDLDFKKFSMSVDEIQEIVNDVLSK